MTASPFTPWGTSHVAALLAFGALVAGLLAASRRLSPAGSRGLGRALGVTILCVQAPFQVYSMLPANWSLAYSLPFELCDLAWMAAVLALWTRSAPWTYCTYYWGLTLTSQAMVTPRLEQDFPSAQFCMFWAQHGLTVAAAIYCAWGLRLRPTWRGYRVTLVATTVWIVLMLAFNSAFGTNYLFLNEKPPRSILDLLGDWPWYILSEAALTAAFWALITWPWARAQRGGGVTNPSGSAPSAPPCAS